MPQSVRSNCLARIIQSLGGAVVEQRIRIQRVSTAILVKKQSAFLAIRIGANTISRAGVDGKLGVAASEAASNTHRA